MQNWLKNPQRSIDEKISYFYRVNIRLTVYYTDELIARHQIRNIDSFGLTRMINQEGEINCVIVNENRVYICPKIRFNAVVQQNHTSLTRGAAVDFSGSLRKKFSKTLNKCVWILDNQSGHYKTRASKIITCLKAFQDNNIGINEDLYVEGHVSWVANGIKKYKFARKQALKLLNDMEKL